VDSDTEDDLVAVHVVLTKQESQRQESYLLKSYLRVLIASD
jgi:hypothetical protein